MDYSKLTKSIHVHKTKPSSGKIGGTLHRQWEKSPTRGNICIPRVLVNGTDSKRCFSRKRKWGTSFRELILIYTGS